jgi:hypothetical protein
MRSPVVALTWEIWGRNRGWILAILAITAFSWTLGSGDHSEPLMEFLGMTSFLLLFAVFDYTEFSWDNARSFPSRLFTLPVSSFRLVAVPVLLGVVSVELLYLYWMGRIGGKGATGSVFVAVLLGAFMVVYETLMWTLAAFGPLRLVAVGLTGIVFFAIGFLPATVWSDVSPWPLEEVLTALTAALAGASFLVAWKSIARRRSGGGTGRTRGLPSVDMVASALPRRTRRFASPEAAHFWFEWRSGGITLPVLVGGLLLLVLGPLSWLLRDDPAVTLRVLVATVAMPALLAIPIGVAFSKPMFWSEDLSVPAFFAIRPLSSGELVLIKMKVAALAAAISWLLVLAFLAVWLPLWADLDALGRLERGWGTAALFALAAMFLTWRFLVSGLWSGLSGNRRLYFACGITAVFAPIAIAVVSSEIDPGWILEDPQRVLSLLWIGTIALAVKYGIAVQSWRRAGSRDVRRLMLLVWLGATTFSVVLSLLFWRILQPLLPPDAYRIQALLILLALLAVPIARLLIAPSFLARNRHR